MIGALKKRLIYGRTYYGLEHVNIGQKDSIQILEVGLIKGDLHISNETSIEDLNELSTLVKEKQHAIVVINNKHVLSRKIDGKMESAKAVHTAFPNIKLEEFYYESFSNESNTFVNICRKQYVDSLLKSYSELKLPILGISLGNSVVTSILPYCDIDLIDTSNANISIANNNIQDIVINNKVDLKKFTLNGLSINSYSINAFGGILAYLGSSELLVGNLSQITSNLRSNFLEKRIFDLGLKFGLGFFFVLFLINFLIFSHYNDRNKVLESELVINWQYQLKLTQLQSEVGKKKRIVDQINNAESIQISHYLDQIAESVPNTILLSDLSFQPIHHNLKENKEAQFTLGKITVKGSSLNGDQFSSWLAFLESIDWIRFVTVSNYELDKKSNNLFDLNIILKQ